MNAHSEGVSNQPKISPLAKPNQTQQATNSNIINSVPASSTSSMGAAAMGMPYQVFPTSPSINSSSVPPPPPPIPTMNVLQTKSNNGDVKNASNSSQSFEPPPIGCRPEIKIPANPMANLKRAPRPQPKGQDYWVDEYRQEKMNNQNDNTDHYTYSPQNEQYSNENEDQSEENDFPSETSMSSNMRAQIPDYPSNIQSPTILTQSPIPANLPPPITPTKNISSPVASPIKNVQQPNYDQNFNKIGQQSQFIQSPQQPKSNIIISTMPQVKNVPIPVHKDVRIQIVFIFKL